MTCNNTQSNLFLIFKPTLSCNLRCGYCYSTSHDEKTTGITMSKESIFHVFNWFAEYCSLRGYSKITILWHGGEPLLIAPNIMKDVLEFGYEIFSQYGIRCEYQIQSNLTIITDDRIELIKDYFKSKIGGSLDYSTSARCYLDGKDSTENVLQNILYLKESGIKVSVITMLCPQNISKLDELYSYFKQYQIPFQVTRVFPTSSGETFNQYSLTDEEYVKAMVTLYDIWFNDNEHPVSISNFIESSYSLLTNKVHICDMSKSCQPHYMGVHPDGSLFPCGRFDINQFCIGNLYQQSPEEFMNSESQNSFSCQYPPHRKCDTCKYFSICNGGCMYERIVRPSSTFCPTKQIYGHIEMRLAESGYSRGQYSK